MFTTEVTKHYGVALRSSPSLDDTCLPEMVRNLEKKEKE